MAHKKGVGSSRNGRDAAEAPRRQKSMAARPSPPGASWCGQCGTKLTPEQRRTGQGLYPLRLISGVVKFENMNRKRPFSVLCAPVAGSCAEDGRRLTPFPGCVASSYPGNIRGAPSES